MRIDIRTSKFSLSEGLKEHIERRVKFSFSWADDSLSRITVRLADINGPKGGNDKMCRIQIPIIGSSSIVVEEVQADLYIAIDRAIDRADRTLVRKFERKREYAHRRYDSQEHNNEITEPVIQ